MHTCPASIEGRRPSSVARLAAGLGIACGLGVACGQSDPLLDPGSGPAGATAVSRQAPETGPGLTGHEFSIDARHDTAQALLEDLEAPHDPSDGGGRAWLIDMITAESEEPTDSVRASGRARVRIGFEVGPHGIAEGGMLMLQSSPFWEWEPAQASVPALGAYTTATTPAQGVELEPETYGGGMAGFTVRGRALRPGERVEIVYGAGPQMARVDRFAEAEARVWIQVDGDGDGIRKPLASSPTIRVHAAGPARVVVRPPTTAEPGDAVEVRIAVLDSAGNAGVPFEGTIRLASAPGLELPESVTLTAADGGLARIEATVEKAGVYRVLSELALEAAGPDGEPEPYLVRSLSGPLVARQGVQKVLWADLHGHSGFSDGTGTPDDYYRYARDVAGLDVSALTDHDHWGMIPLDSHPGMWERIARAAADFHEPGRFVTLLGYEWTSWLQGHRHVLYFDTDDAAEASIFSSIDAEGRYDTPDKLWDALRGRSVLTFAHHSAGGPVSTNWSYPPDPVLEPITEIVSVHGSSEAPDSPRPIYQPLAGNFVRDVLDHGYRLGFIGSGDSHDGHPGLAHLASPSGNNGLAAILAEDLTRASVLEALRARRSYATNGVRIWLRTLLDGVHPMGAEVGPNAGGEPHTLQIQIAAEAELSRVELVRGGQIVASLDGEHRREWSAETAIDPLGPGDYLYVRAVQENGGAAWSSPYFGPPRSIE